MIYPMYSGPPTDKKWEKILNITITPAPGSVEMPCSECKQGVWVGPRLQSAMKNSPAPLICMVCALKAGATADDLVPLGPGGHKFTPR